MELLIVDDQEAVRESMKIIVDWRKLGINRVYTAKSAAEARHIAKANPIDMVLTDIEMPGEDGLSLAAWFAEKYPAVKCIFLTSHADFSYAREAIKNGGFDYILQPAAPEEISAAVTRCMQSIEDDMSVGSMATMSVFNSRGGRREVSRWFDTVVPGNNAVWAFPMWLDYYDRLVNMKTQKLRDYLEGAWSGYRCSTVYMGYQKHHHCYGAIVYGSLPVPGRRQIQMLAEGYLVWLKSFDKGKVSIYVGQDAGEDLGKLTEQVLTLWDDNVSDRTGVFYTVKQGSAFLPQKQRRDEWVKWMSVGEGEMIRKELHSMLGFREARGELSLEYMRRLHALFDEVCVISCYNCGIRREALYDDSFTPELYRASFHNVESFEKAVAHCVLAFNEQLRLGKDGGREPGMGERIRKITEYIDRNITENISRSEAAEMAFLSEDYFSRVFKQQTGLGFKEYVTKKKMEHSQMLLRDTDFPVGVVAAKVGYNNFSNFTSQFKKYTGMSPLEYRAQMRT